MRRATVGGARAQSALSQIAKAARESAAPHLPSAAVIKLTHLRREIKEIFGEQALVGTQQQPLPSRGRAWTITVNEVDAS